MHPSTIDPDILPAPPPAVSKASRVRAALNRHPYLSSTEIGRLVGVSCEYVRAIKKRSAAGKAGLSTDELHTAVHAYQKLLTLRRACFAHPGDIELYGKYVEASRAQKAAEKAFLQHPVPAE